MPIIGPPDLPAILKMNTPLTNEIKKYVLTQLGYPTVDVELTEDQFETILRTSGDFITHYFPKEGKLAMFRTVPLVGTYDLPSDAYWVQEVAWDPVVTNIGDIFSAESFLFCFGAGMKVLRCDGALIDVLEWRNDYRIKTPYGSRMIVIETHDAQQDLVQIDYDGGKLICTPNHPVKIKGTQDMINDWVSAVDSFGHVLVDANGELHEIYDVSDVDRGETTTIYAVGAHCLYGCHDGVPVMVH